MRRTTILAAALCAALIPLALAGQAPAKIVDLHVYKGVYPAGSFDGTGSVGAPAPFEAFSLHQLDINQANGDFIVGAAGMWYRFNSAGVPKAFPGAPPNTAIGPQSQNAYGDVAVDDSGGTGGVGEGEQGRVYAQSENGPIMGWKANGEPLPAPFGPPGLSFGAACGLDVAPDGDVWVARWNGTPHVVEFNPDGTPTGTSFNTHDDFGVCGLEIDAAGNFLIVDESGPTYRYSPAGVNLGIFDPDQGEARDVAADRNDGHVYTVHGSYVNEYDSSGGLLDKFGGSEGGFPGLENAESVAVNEATGVVYVTNNTFPQPRVDSFVRTGPITVPDVITNDAGVTPTTATLKGQVDPDAANAGTPIDFCNFEWGVEPSNLENDIPCDQALPINAPTAVTATINSGLTLGTTYFYRLTASNEGNGVLSVGGNKEFEPAGPPQITDEAVSEVNTDGVRITAEINPGGGDTTYRIEYGTTEAYGLKIPVPDGEIEDNLLPEVIDHAISGLAPATTYHYRITAVNTNGPAATADHTFTTFPINPKGADPCANAQVRQQTGASLLLDCRAYELASAADTDGYDVTSDLVPGLVTLPSQPRANDRVLYSLQFGRIPGTGDPTNYGQDPYVATRGSGGWTTTYVGIPASGTPSAIPFGSPLAGSSSGLSTFAFGDGVLCDPCFADGSTGIPVRMSNGSLVQGLKGSLPSLSAEPSGYIGQSLSDDGGHLVFGSTSKIEPAGNAGTLTIYDRNLSAGTTQVASTLPNGSTMTGTVAGLDVSADGSRVLVGREVSTDGAGNTYYDLYMHVGTSPNSVLVADTPGGVLFNGMTGDGSKVFFTTPDALAGDTDTGADLYRADVGATSATVTRVSTGASAGDTDACNPVPGKEGPDWNALAGGPDCSVVGLAGGSGVASGDGTVYFLSPEKLDGSGTLNEVNLFVVRPSGSPRLVATLEPGLEMVTNALVNNEVHRFQDFQATPGGGHAVLTSALPLTGFNTFGRSEVFRYDANADTLVCVSCSITGAAPTSDTGLSSGLNIADDGTVFFTSSEALVLRDTNSKLDVYEWKEGEQQLVSTGISNFDSGLLGVSADGVNAFFFTRATLAPQDKNGETMKVYDARAGGGFLSVPPLPLCAAKDECHGPGTVQAPAPQIGTFKGEGGNAKGKKCKKGFVKKKGKCKKKHKKKKGKKKGSGR